MPAGTTYEAIDTTTLSSAAASVTFSNISGNYTDLVVVFNGAASASGQTTNIQFNSDTGSNYSTTWLYGNGSAGGSGRGSSATKIYLGFVQIGASTTYENNLIAHIMNYANTTTYKTVVSRSNVPSQTAEACVGLWRSTSAITSLVFTTSTGNFASGSTFTLYGIKAA